MGFEDIFGNHHEELDDEGRPVIKLRENIVQHDAPPPKPKVIDAKYKEVRWNFDKGNTLTPKKED